MLAETRAAFALEAAQNVRQTAVIGGADRLLVVERIVPNIHHTLVASLDISAAVEAGVRAPALDRRRTQPVQLRPG